MGIDASRRQMAAGQEILNQLPGKNVRLECRDILEITPEFGQFDYIICHGVFSWVPRNVQDHILAICQQNLSPSGIAYVSYNTYPGWRMRGTIRDMMVFHTRRYETPQDRVGHSRALLDFLVKTVPEENNAYGRFLRSEMELLRDKADYYLLHEHLEAVNEPIYFHEFAERAAEHKLQYIAEAEWGASSLEGFGPNAEKIVRALGRDQIECEQYVDFLRNRMFRQTLLCHAEAKLDRRPEIARLRGLHWASPVVPKGPAKIRSDEPQEFTAGHGTLTTKSPLLKAALLALSERWPESLSLTKLLAVVQSRLYVEPVVDAKRIQADEVQLGERLLECLSRRFVEVSACPPPCAAIPAARPLASPLARLQAKSSPRVANLLHQMVSLTDMGREVLQLSDGQRDEAENSQIVLDKVNARQLVHIHDEEGKAQPEEVRSMIGRAVQDSLRQLARQGLILAE